MFIHRNIVCDPARLSWKDLSGKLVQENLYRCFHMVLTAELVSWVEEGKKLVRANRTIFLWDVSVNISNKLMRYFHKTYIENHGDETARWFRQRSQNSNRYCPHG